MFEKVKEHSKKVTAVLCFLAVALALSYRLTRQREAGLERDYLRAHGALKKLKGGDETGFAALKEILKKRSQFYPAFAPALANRLITQKRLDEARPFLPAMKGFEKGAARYHLQFAQTSLLIAKQEFALALVDAQELHRELVKNNSEETSLLKAFNLLRIALLEQEVGTKEGELKAWQAFDGLDGACKNSLYELLSQQDVSLKNYLTHRISALTGLPDF